MLAAGADWPTIVDAHMPAFSGGAGAAVIDASIEHNAGSDSGAERGVENVVVAALGSPDGFGEGCGVCVVVDFHGHAVNLADARGQGKISPAGKIRGIEHDSGFGIERPGGADADGFNRRFT